MDHEKVKQALEQARHILTTLNGLIAADGAAPGLTWEINERDIIRQLDDAIASFDRDSHPA